MWEMSRLYKGLAQNYLGQSYPYRPVQYMVDRKEETEKVSVEFSASAITSLVSVMADIHRPREDRFWFKFENEKKLHGRQEQVTDTGTPGLSALMENML